MTEPINLSGKCLLSSLNKGAECYFVTDFYTTGYLFLCQRSRPLQAIRKNAGSLTHFQTQLLAMPYIISFSITSFFPQSDQK